MGCLVECKKTTRPSVMGEWESGREGKKRVRGDHSGEFGGVGVKKCPKSGEMGSVGKWV